MDQSRVAVCVWVEGCTSLAEVLEFFSPFEVIPGFLVTAYLPPAIVGRLPDGLPGWLRVGALGWEGAPHECEAWGEDECREMERRIRELGYRAPFMPPRGVETSRNELRAGFQRLPIHWPDEKPRLVRQLAASFDRGNPTMVHPLEHPLFRVSVLGSEFSLFLPTEVLAEETK